MRLVHLTLDGTPNISITRHLEIVKLLSSESANHYNGILIKRWQKDPPPLQKNTRQNRQLLILVTRSQDNKSDWHPDDCVGCGANSMSGSSRMLVPLKLKI